MSLHFARFAHWASDAMGAPLAFVLALVVVLLWALSGPLFGFSSTWQLVINTGTTIFTFWMVFLVQHTTLRDTRALQAKLDELVKSLPDADDALIGIEKREEAPA